MSFFSKFLRLLKSILLFWTSILFVRSRKNYSHLFRHFVVLSLLTSIPWFCVKQPKENGRKSRLRRRDPWCILATASSNLRRRSLTPLQFSMRAHLKCLDWFFRKMFGTTFKPRRTWRCIEYPHVLFVSDMIFLGI
jgi:hypothetical protein